VARWKKVLASGEAKPEMRLCHVCKHEVIAYEKCLSCGAMPKDERTPML
jgi:hypothetical protein